MQKECYECPRISHVKWLPVPFYPKMRSTSLGRFLLCSSSIADSGFVVEGPVLRYIDISCQLECIPYQNTGSGLSYSALDLAPCQWTWKKEGAQILVALQPVW